MKLDTAVFEKMPPAEQVFEEMLPYLEILDAQIGGIIRLLKDRGITTNGEFAQYAQRGDDASNVRERGMRARMEYLFASAAKRFTAKVRWVETRKIRDKKNCPSSTDEAGCKSLMASLDFLRLTANCSGSL